MSNSRERIVQQIVGLMDGPPPRIPRRVEAGMRLAGKRVIVFDRDADDWIPARAAGDPYWRDENEVDKRWLHGDLPPDGASEAYAQLIVPVCNESDWFVARHEGTRPETIEWPAWQVWTEI